MTDRNTNEMKSINCHTNDLYLDPNNYRFIDNKDYRRVSEKDIHADTIQKRTNSFLTGKNNENIQDLITSYKVNGILPVNQIQVKRVELNTTESYFLVLEGNRRVAALKFLYSEYKEKGNDIGKLTVEDFEKIPVIEHADDYVVNHMIVMGLEHIAGKKKWSPVNQAQLIEDLINQHNMTEDEICDSLGITKYILRRTRRALGFVNRYKSSDYGDQFTSSMYSIFEEMIKSPDIKNWLEWDDNVMSPGNSSNEERFFSWISREEEIERDENTGEEISRKIKEPIITKSQEIRDLAKYIKEQSAIERMEELRSVTQGFAFSDAVGESKFKNAMENLQQDVGVVFNFSEHMKPDHIEDIKKLRNKIDRLLPTSNGNITPYAGTAPIFSIEIKGFLKQLHIKRYRRLIELKISHINRINIFAGKNNSGKTSMLEAVYLLSQLNDINAILELERYRGKFGESFNPKWLSRNISEEIEIDAVNCDEKEISLTMTQEQTTEYIDKSAYITTIIADSEINGNSLQSSINLFSNKEAEVFFQKSNVLCYSAFTSPYRHNDALLRRAHMLAVKNKFIDDIINFIRDYIDPEIVRIEMVNIEGESRFYVHSKMFAESIDITKYGEGVQRIFEIALLFGYCQNGILCIDEFESAIHAGLLKEFSKFVQQLADRYNVQVFLSTHSKECIDAFINNQYKNDEITGYTLREKQDGSIECKYVDGLRLESLIESINFDMRG